MINAVTSFFPSIISRAVPTANQSASSAQTNVAFSPAQTNSVSASSSFADKIQAFFTISPSDFSALFSDVGGSSQATTFPDLASAAYTQSTRLTANRLSVNV